MTMYGGNMYQTAAPGLYATNPGMQQQVPMMATQQQQQLGFGGGFQTMGTVSGDAATNSYADVFPQPQGSHAAHAQPAYQPLATANKPRTRERAPPRESFFRVYENSRPRLCLLITCLLALVFPIILLFTTMNSRSDQSFTVYSELSVADGASDFSTILLLLAICAVVAMIVALAGVAVSHSENITMLRVFVVAALALSFVLMVIGMYTFISNNSTQPTVVRTANEVCQAQASTSASWGCTAGLLPGAAPVAAVPAATTHGGAANWLASQDPAVGTAGSIRCAQLAFLCTAPANFPAESACSCSGQSAEAWVQAPTPQATGRLVGAYCNNWGNGTAAGGSTWCFVSQYVACGEITLDAATGYLRSNGPCLDTVDSRSQAVYDGASQVQTACLWTAVVGLCLLIAAWAGLWVHSSPETGATQLTTRGLNPMATHSNTRDTAARFDQAQRDAVSRITAGTPERVKLEIYGYYKQAKDGDVVGGRPGMLNALERKKYDAWARHNGMPREEAMLHYCSAVDLV